MEAHTQSVEDNLINSLSFKLRPGASYVVNRRSVTYWPSGSDTYGPTQTRVIKIALNGDSWLDPATTKLFFTITNNHATEKLLPRVPVPWIFFRRVRVLCGGQIVEDIDDYNRLHQMFHLMKPTEKRLNDFVEGFGVASANSLTFDHELLEKAAAIPSVASAPNNAMTLAFTPFVGLLRQDKYLPIRYAPIQFEFELVNDPLEAVYGTGGGQITGFLSANFTISDVQLKCDLVELDNTLDNEYTQYLMQGKSLPIHFTALSHGSQIFTNIKTDVKVSRSLTRLKSVFLSMIALPSTRACPKGVPNDFWHPMSSGGCDYTKELQLQIQIGSKLYPEYPIRSLAEAFYQLRKTLGLHFGNEAMAIQKRYYNKDSFIASVDLEKVLGSSFTGQNTMDGQMLTIRMQSSNASTIALPSDTTCSLYYCLAFDSIMSVGLTGIEALE
jgi:hypothetical protein